MFKGQSKSSLETLGLIFTIIFTVFIITLIFLTGYDYNETYTRWSDGPFYCIGPLQLSMVVISFVDAVLGILNFSFLKNNSTIRYIVKFKIYKNSFLFIMDYHVFSLLLYQL